MADTDNTKQATSTDLPVTPPVMVTQAPDKSDKGSVLGTLGNATAGLYAGGLAASHLVGSEKSLNKQAATAQKSFNKAEDALEAKKDKMTPKLLKKDGANVTAKSNFENLTLAHENAVKQFSATHSAEYANLFETLESKKKGQLTVRNLEADIKMLQNKDLQAITPVSETLVAMKKEQIAAVKKVVGEKGFGDVGSSVASVKLETAISDAEKAFLENQADPKQLTDFLEKFKETHSVAHAEAKNAILKKVDADAAETLTNTMSTSSKELKRSATALERESGWKKTLEEATSKESGNFNKAKAAVEEVGSMKALNSRKGIWNALKKPFDVLEHGTQGAKTAIIVTAVTLGTVGVAVSRAKHIQKQKQASFAEAYNHGKAFQDPTNGR